MKASTHVFSLIAVALGSLAASFLLLNQLNPADAKLPHFILLFALLFLIVFALTSLLGISVRRLFWKSEARNNFLKVAERQGGLLGLLAVSSLLLQKFSLLNIFTAVILLILFTLFELYIQ